MTKPFVLTGERYETEVPDTLDLAERAGMAVNALSNMVDPEHDYAAYFCANFNVQPPYMSGELRASKYNGLKLTEVLPMLRIMSGSSLNFDVDEKILASLISNIDDDGMFWVQKDGYVGMWNQVYAMMTLASWYQLDRDPKKKKLVGKMAEALAKLAIYKDDYAYYPYVAWYDKGWKYKSGWETTDEPGGQPIYCLGKAMAALTRRYIISGDEKALDLANKLKNFLLKPKFWVPAVEPKMMVSAEHGHWTGHMHSQLAGIWYMLEYAILANDAHLKEFIREFYEYTRNFGIARIGFFPGMLGEDIGKMEAWEGVDCGLCTDPRSPSPPCEGCCVGDMTCLAIKLCDAGVGDYWEDVDQYVRNHLVEHQLLRRDLLEDISKSGAKIITDVSKWTAAFPGRWISTDRVIEKNIGSFSSLSDPTITAAWYTICCPVNIGKALYYAWEATVRCKDNVAQVNLLLNRASLWLDVDSYLPYEGKVVIKNKISKKVSVRIPLWVEKNAVKSSINGKEANPFWLSNYIVFDKLAKKDMITIEFPVVEETAKYTYLGTEYTCHFKGNTLVDITPRAKTPGRSIQPMDDETRIEIKKGYPMYQRDHYKKNKAPIKRVTRYVSPIFIKW